MVASTSSFYRLTATICFALSLLITRSASYSFHITTFRDRYDCSSSLVQHSKALRPASSQSLSCFVSKHMRAPAQSPLPSVEQRCSSRLHMASSDLSDGEMESKPTRSSSSSSPLDRPLLAGVDAGALLLFAAIGRANHGSAGDGSSDDGLLQTLATAAPFLVAWFLTSPLTGVYNNDQSRPETSTADPATDDSKPINLVVDTWKQILPGWAVAIPLGCVLRGVVRGYAPPVPFVVVALLATLVLLGFGRLAFSVVEDFFVELV